MHGTHSAGQAIASREPVRLTWENLLVTLETCVIGWFGVHPPHREGSGTLKRLEAFLIEGGAEMQRRYPQVLLTGYVSPNSIREPH